MNSSVSFYSVLSSITKQFQTHGIDTARLDAELLLAHVLKKNRSELFLLPRNHTLTPQQSTDLQELVEKRCKRIPHAYLVGEKEFYSLRFSVTPDVLIPRPDTELLVEQALLHIEKQQTAFIIDVGTGSGAIACSIITERPLCQCIAIDISLHALQVAYKNILYHQLEDNIHILQASLLSPIKAETCDVIVSNPPYVPLTDKLSLAAELQYEPPQALFAGQAGLDYFPDLFTQAYQTLKPNGWILVEHDYRQTILLHDMIAKLGFKQIETKKDLAGKERVTKAQK